MLQVRDAVRDVFPYPAFRRRRWNHRRSAPASKPDLRCVCCPLWAAQLAERMSKRSRTILTSPLLLSLEEFDPETKQATKTADFRAPHFGTISAS